MLGDRRLIQSIRLQNFLSFGPDAEEIELKSLNVLIGPNASGKSNLIEAVGFLQASPIDLGLPIREGGGIL
jgi:AAA15 family ATPase/GTPase